jgi:hypothetical protein
MNYPTALIIAALFCAASMADPEQTTCDSPCNCQDAYGEGRWSVKTDASLPPTDASAIQAVTPSDMFSWPGPDAPITMQSERTGIENKWFAVTGRVVELKVEEDGDLHIALHDVSGDKPGVVVCEIPAQPQWCEIRTTIFKWTPTRFPFHTGSGKKLSFGRSPVMFPLLPGSGELVLTSETSGLTLAPDACANQMVEAAGQRTICGG